MKQKETSTPIRVWWSEKDNTVLIEPQDMDRFTLNIEVVIRACKAYDARRRSDIHARIMTLLDKLGAWLRQHDRQVDHAFLTARDNDLLFLVVRSCKQFDQDLEDALTDLDLEVARDEDLSCFDLNVLALPKCEEDKYHSFIDHSLYFIYRKNAQH